MSKYTPGPWTWGNDYWGLYGSGPDNEVLTYERYEGMWVAFGDKQKANANLISAAPDLLECLEMIVAEADSYIARTGKPVYNWLDDSRAAIAKARGENQK